MASRTSATESPGAGVGASERSTTPNETPSSSAASRPTSSPTLVILKAVRLISSARSMSDRPGSASTAALTTPGPEMPTLTTASASPGPCTAPAMKGLSSGMFAKTTSFAHAMPSRSAVASAISLIKAPIRTTASMLMPAFVEATATEEQTRSVPARAAGRLARSRSSPGVIPFWT